jgi:xanthine dehydrogenase accessory factor
MDWLASLLKRLQSGNSAVRVTVAAVRGSAPREPGACMLVGYNWEEGTIGGGHLELLATDIARRMLENASETRGRLDRFPLGATLGQCCGGVVELWFERFTAADATLIEEALALRASGAPVVLATAIAGDAAVSHRLLVDGSIGIDSTAEKLLRGGPGIARAELKKEDAGVFYERLDDERTPLWLFGAGHVGKALVRILDDLPFDITWVDSREAIFPGQVSDPVRIAHYDEPVDAVRDAPQATVFLVMTHSHDLDFDICRAILGRDDFLWAGLIGSKTKAARFVQRLRQRGVPEMKIARLTCPIGVDGIDSKLPGAIAVAVAAQVLQAVERARAAIDISNTSIQVKS